MGFLAIVIWSFSALLATEITTIPPFELLSCQFALAFFVTMIRYLYSKEKSKFFNFTKNDLIVTSIALTVNQACYFSAFRYSPAAQVDLINYLWPTLLILFSSFLPNEKFCLAYLLSCCMCLWGLFNLISLEEMMTFSYDSMFGLILAFLAAISWALYSVYIRYSHSNSANCISCASSVAAFLCMLLHLHYETFVLPNLFESIIIFLLGVIQTGLAFYFWESSVKNGQIKLLGLAVYIVPVLSVLILIFFEKAEFESGVVIATAAISLSPLLPLMKNLLFKPVTA